MAAAITTLACCLADGAAHAAPPPHSVWVHPATRSPADKSASAQMDAPASRMPAPRLTKES